MEDKYGAFVANKVFGVESLNYINAIKNGLSLSEINKIYQQADDEFEKPEEEDRWDLPQQLTEFSNRDKNNVKNISATQINQSQGGYHSDVLFESAFPPKKEYEITTPQKFLPRQREFEREKKELDIDSFKSVQDITHQQEEEHSLTKTLELDQARKDEKLLP